MTDDQRLRVAVAVASYGRPGNLKSLLETLATQSQLPDQVLVVVTKQADCPEVPGLPFDVETRIGAKGTSHQRNLALAHLSPDIDVVVFYDDDFVPSQTAVEGIARAFDRFDDINAMSGLVLLDGINGPGIPAAKAQQIVRDWDRANPPTPPAIIAEQRGCYGCNMAFRTAAIKDIWFDENLAGYAWFEDLDFSARVPGQCIQTDAFAGVHCGEKGGREQGRSLGRAQVVNPIYLWRKGSLPFTFAFVGILRHLLINHLRMLRPEPWVDRKGRAMGNWSGICNVILRRPF